MVGVSVNERMETIKQRYQLIPFLVILFTAILTPFRATFPRPQELVQASTTIRLAGFDHIVRGQDGYPG